MHRSLLIFFTLVFVLAFSSAAAQESCDRLDTAYRALSALRSGEHDHLQTMTADTSNVIIYGGTSATTLTPLSPSVADQDLVLAHKQVSAFLARVTGQTSGHLDTESNNFENEILNLSGQNMGRHLVILSNHWGCEIPQTEALERLQSVGVTNEHASSDEPFISYRLPLQQAAAGKLNVSPLKDSKIVILLCIIFLSGLEIFRRVRQSTWKKRRPERRVCFHNTFLKTKREVISSVIVDITPKGAKVRLCSNLPIHSKISIRLNGNWYKAKVKWANSNFAGLQFVRQISQAMVDQIASQQTDPDEGLTQLKESEVI